jgi:hypothetical protein
MMKELLTYFTSLICLTASAQVNIHSFYIGGGVSEKYYAGQLNSFSTALYVRSGCNLNKRWSVFAEFSSHNLDGNTQKDYDKAPAYIEAEWKIRVNDLNINALYHLIRDNKNTWGIYVFSGINYQSVRVKSYQGRGVFKSDAFQGGYGLAGNPDQPVVIERQRPEKYNEFPGSINLNMGVGYSYRMDRHTIFSELKGITPIVISKISTPVYLINLNGEPFDKVTTTVIDKFSPWQFVLTLGYSIRF